MVELQIMGKPNNSTKGESAKAASVESKVGDASWISVVEEKVKGLRFGVVQITIHNGKVVQIESTERTRLDVS